MNKIISSRMESIRTPSEFNSYLSELSKFDPYHSKDYCTKLLNNIIKNKKNNLLKPLIDFMKRKYIKIDTEIVFSTANREACDIIIKEIGIQSISREVVINVILSKEINPYQRIEYLSKRYHLLMDYYRFSRIILCHDWDKTLIDDFYKCITRGLIKLEFDFKQKSILDGNSIYERIRRDLLWMTINLESLRNLP